MHDALRVRGGERLGDSDGDLHRFFVGQRAAFDALREVLAFDELHREESRAVGLVQPEQRRDVGVVECGERLGFALEARQPLGVLAEARRQDLQRDGAIERRVERLPDDTHPALAELLDEAVVQQVRAGFERHQPADSTWGQVLNLQFLYMGSGLESAVSAR